MDMAQPAAYAADPEGALTVDLEAQRRIDDKAPNVSYVEVSTHADTCTSSHSKVVHFTPNEFESQPLGAEVNQEREAEILMAEKG
jgi:hypothetical protein